MTLKKEKYTVWTFPAPNCKGNWKEMDTNCLSTIQPLKKNLLLIWATFPHVFTLIPLSDIINFFFFDKYLKSRGNKRNWIFISPGEAEKLINFCSSELMKQLLLLFGLLHKLCCSVVLNRSSRLVSLIFDVLQSENRILLLNRQYCFNLTF